MATCCAAVMYRHLACEEEREEEVRLLVAAGADATLLNEVDAVSLSITTVLQNFN